MRYVFPPQGFHRRAKQIRLGALEGEGANPADARSELCRQDSRFNGLLRFDLVRNERRTEFKPKEKPVERGTVQRGEVQLRPTDVLTSKQLNGRLDPGLRHFGFAFFVRVCAPQPGWKSGEADKEDGSHFHDGR